MIKLFIIMLLIILIIFIICRVLVFPLSAGNIESGEIAIKNLSKQSKVKNNYKLVAVIIEPREKNLINIINHYMNKLPNYTHFQIYYGNKNSCLIKNYYHNEIILNKISIWDMGVDNLTIQGYNRILLSKEFWETIQGEKVLIFQTDSIPCSKSKYKITDFIEYDFIGAPLSNLVNILLNIYFMGKGYIVNHMKFYNGGLSMRSKSIMLKIIEKYPWDKLTAEDVWFCAFVEKVGGKLPEKKVGRNFSFESEELDNIPWGLHKPRKYYDLLEKISPEIKQIPYIPSHTDYKTLFMI
jgi:hypothetical protein